MKSPTVDRKLLATSHNERYAYYLGDDRYVYQWNAAEGTWAGWLCSLAAWESTFSRSTWMTVMVAV